MEYQPKIVNNTRASHYHDSIEKDHGRIEEKSVIVSKIPKEISHAERFEQPIT